MQESREDTMYAYYRTAQGLLLLPFALGTLFLLELPAIFTAGGLSKVGPIAGGWFASCQGAGLVSAGGVMSLLQSLVMSGWVGFWQQMAEVFWGTVTTAAWVWRMFGYMCFLSPERQQNKDFKQKIT